MHFPVALTVTSLVSDTAGALMGYGDLNVVGAWTLAFAVLLGAVAVAAGYWDMEHDALRPGTHKLVHLHLRIGWTVFACLAALSVWRWLGGSPNVAYLLAGWAVVALVIVQAWLGGELVYSHGAGVTPADQGQSPPEQSQRASRRVYRLLMGRRLEDDDHGSKGHS